MKDLGAFRGDRTNLDGMEPGHWSRQEWMLMYMRGLSTTQIAHVCRVPAKKVDASIRNRLIAEPWRRGRRLFLHDQPALPRPGTPHATRKQRWHIQFEALQRFHGVYGRLPKATSSDPHESSLGHWMYAQRHRHRTNQLLPGQLELLNTVPGWYQPAKTEKETRLWDQRLEELTTYMTTHDRWPTYRTGQKGDLPNVLAAWLWAQRRRHRARALPPNQGRGPQHATSQLAPTLAGPIKRCNAHHAGTVRITFQKRSEMTRLSS